MINTIHHCRHALHQASLMVVTDKVTVVADIYCLGGIHSFTASSDDSEELQWVCRRLWTLTIDLFIKDLTEDDVETRVVPASAPRLV